MLTTLSFPNLFTTGSTKVVYDSAATRQNLKTLLLSTKQSLLGDPNYGTNLKKLIFEQNNSILRDIVIDDIYTTIQVFMPQIVVNRNDIELISERNTLIVNIKAKNMLDYTFENISLALYSLEEAR